MAQAPRKTDLISVRELPSVVDRAVRLAQARVRTVPDTAPAIKKWEIYGRYVKDLNIATSFANEVTAELGKAGFSVKPAVLMIDRGILCGFIERGNIPVERNF